ncbi:MAG: hypothetical protein PUA49_08680 [Butyrivibrio sp.]|nr:hypothetical protein [Butyrivibrio sp.]
MKKTSGRPQKKDKKIFLHTSIDVEAKRRIEQYCHNNHVSVSAYINQLAYTLPMTSSE